MSPAVMIQDETREASPPYALHDSLSVAIATLLGGPFAGHSEWLCRDPLQRTVYNRRPVIPAWPVHTNYLIFHF